MTPRVGESEASARATMLLVSLYGRAAFEGIIGHNRTDVVTTKAKTAAEAQR